jgi:hypothetical protein
MLEKLIDFVCGYENIAFESEFDLDTSVRRLAGEIKPHLGGFRPLVSGRVRVVVGEVSEQRVSLWSETLIWTDGWGATFIGKFQIVNDRVLLIGKLGLTEYLLAFFSLAVAMAAVVTILTVSELTKNPGDLALWATALFGGPTMILFVVASARAFKWLCSGNERSLLVAIRSALQPNH